jgi:hypothetical protein
MGYKHRSIDTSNEWSFILFYPSEPAMVEYGGTFSDATVSKVYEVFQICLSDT